MPYKGWTVLQARTIYKQALEAAYDSKKRDLIEEDISSFNAYFNEKILKGMALQEITDRFKITDYSDEFPVLDRYLKKTFRVAVREGKLVCLTDESGEDVHTFFVKNDLKFREAVEARGHSPRAV